MLGTVPGHITFTAPEKNSGAEADGLRRLTREHCDELVGIPLSSAVESLNVSVASGISLFEARRQQIR